MADWDDQNCDEGNFTKVDGRSRSRNSYEDDDNSVSKSTRNYDSSNDKYRQNSERKQVQSNDNYLSLSDEEKRLSRNKKLSDEADSQVSDKSLKKDNERNRRNYEEISPYKTSKQNNDEFDQDNKKNFDEEAIRQRRKTDDDLITKKSDLSDDNCSKNRKSIVETDDWGNENTSNNLRKIDNEDVNKKRNDDFDSRRSYAQNDGEDRKSNRRNFDDNNENRGFRKNFNDNDDENRRSSRRNDNEGNGEQRSNRRNFDNNEGDGERRSFRRNDNEGDGEQRSNRRNFDNNEGDGERRSFRRNDNEGDGEQRSNRRNFDNNDGDNRRSFRRNDNEGDEERRSFRRNDNEGDGEQRSNRRNFDNNDGDNRRSFRRNDNEGDGERRSFRRNDNEGDGEQRSNRRNFDNNDNDNRRSFKRNDNEGDGERRSFRRNDNEGDGERRSFRRNDNEGDGERRSFRRNDNEGDGEQRSNRRNFDNNDNDNRRSFKRNDNEGDGERRSFRRNDNEGDGERRSFRRNDNEGDGEERRSSRRNDNEENRGSRRNFDNDDGENADDKPREKYIPPTFSKEDDELFYNITEGINFSKFEKIPVKKVGEDIPDPIESFSEATKNKSLHDAISKSNYKTLTPIQKHSIPIISEGRDLMAAAQTGSGKTVTFLLPLIEKLLNDPNALNKEKGFKCSPEVVIISPTRELAIQIYQQALKLTFRNDIKSSLIYGGANFFDQKNRLSSDSNIVVATPGRLAHFLEKDLITFSETKYLVLDEADRLIDQGFIPQVENIVFGFDLSKNRQTLMFSATFSETVQDLAKKFLKDDFIFVSIGILGAANSDVEQEIILTTYREKKNLLLETVKKIYHPKTKILVFTEKKKTTDFIALTLSLSDFQSISFHGDRLQSQREQALDLFKKGETPILVATSAASRGLDIKGVEYVINYDIPKEVDEYVHRIGRTGRLGNFGKAISFYDPDENSSIKSSLVKVLKDSNQNIPDFLNDGDNYDSTNYSYNTSSFPEETKYEQKNEVSQQVDDADDW